MIKEIIEKYLTNSKNRIEGQRIKESWFVKNNLQKEWTYLKNNNIIDTKTLYMFINNVTDKCECNNVKRFVSFKEGFKKHCEKCSRSKFNYMKIQKNIIVENDTLFLLRDEIKQELYKLKDINNNYSSSKINMYENLVSKIIASTYYMNRSIAERIYHIDNNLFELPKCKKCNNDLDNFFSNTVGYRTNYCKENKCAYSNNKNTKLNQLKYYYNKIINTYKDKILEDYTYNIFSFDDYKDKRNNSIINITHNCGYNYDIQLGYQGHIKCPKCFPIRSKKQYELYNLYKEYVISYNNRQLIKPKEIDILFENFAIEYDSIVYHSYGKHKLSYLNNVLENSKIHLNKTELCEQQNIQLFRIFSNEWITKQEIWKSIINSKLQKNNKIYARKCIVKEVPNVEAIEFLNNNHLQGSINAKIKLGLYYNSELVSIMTFSKSRYNKSIEYELIRFCSKLNNTIIGGASKLLKHFELNYKPKSLISYANRRWSQGNVYEKLGFEFKYNTTPNYFYFKGNDSSILLSRVQFQKHKLNDKLKFFDTNLTETENMYNNDYRKIYDCGNKVYLKEYKYNKQ